MAPIKNILVPSTGNMIGGGGVQEFYDLDVDKLSREQLRQIFEIVAAQCKASVDEVAKGIQEQGRMPLRALHVSGVSTDSMAFL